MRPQIQLKFGIQNPTNQSAEIRSIVGQVEANGKTIADVSNFVALKIEPNSETLLPIKADPAAYGIASNIFSLFGKDRPKQLDVRFTGTANVDGVNIPISASATI